MSAGPLDRRLAIVTGASRGFGEAVARAFWDAGASVLLTARTESALRDLVASLPPRAGQRAAACAVDLADPDAPGRVIDAARAMGPRLDILVNNAAVQGPIGPVWKNDWDAWRRTIHLNLLAPVALCRAVVPWMREGGGGSVVNMAGGGATSSRPNFSAYAASKTALVRFTEVLADETRAINIRVFAVAPGILPTAMQREVAGAGEAVAGTKDYNAARKSLAAGDPSAFREPVELCVYLAGDAPMELSGRLISARWDPWRSLAANARELAGSDLYTLRRVTPG